MNDAAAMSVNNILGFEVTLGFVLHHWVAHFTLTEY